MALHRFHQLQPESVEHLADKIRRSLCDRAPAVMGASVCLLHDMARKAPLKFKDLVPSLVSILKQITEHRLPRDFDYHRMPAPWVQLRLLRVLSLLGHGDQVEKNGEDRCRKWWC
jgi:AP-4 complex subunit epsilon-1